GQAEPSALRHRQANDDVAGRGGAYCRHYHRFARAALKQFCRAHVLPHARLQGAVVHPRLLPRRRDGGEDVARNPPRDEGRTERQGVGAGRSRRLAAQYTPRAHRMHGRTFLEIALVSALLAAVPAPAQEAWKPSRPVTLIAPNAPGGTSDRTSREIQRIIQKHKLVEVPINVVNRPGGNGTLALNQLNSQPGDP